MQLQEEAFTLEVLAAVTRAQVEDLSQEALVILQKALVQNHIIVVQVPKTTVQAAVGNRQKEVIFQYLSQYPLATAAIWVEVITMEAA